MSKKGLRKIMINGKSYNWKISNENHFLILVCEKSYNEGSKIIVNLDSETHKFWLEFPHVENLNLRPITPRDVKEIISQAIEQGWNPEAKGAILRFEYSSKTNNLFKI
ncbi:hypothetical protein AN1V17_15840 [Vallitalea sediminicola]